MRFRYHLVMAMDRGGVESNKKKWNRYLIPFLRAQKCSKHEVSHMKTLLMFTCYSFGGF